MKKKEDKDKIINELVDEILIGSEESFWKAQPTGGRRKEYSPHELWDCACQYFEWVDNNPLIEEKIFSTKIGIVSGTVSKKRPYTKGGLSIFLGISVRTLHKYSNDELNYHDFIPIMEIVNEIIYTQKFEGAASGFFKEGIISKDLGLVDKKQIEMDIDYEIIIGDDDDEK